MESLDPAACFVDDLLNFDSGIGEEDDDEEHSNKPVKAFPSSISFLDDFNDPVDDSNHPSLPESAEEELEWLSNKDAFPSVETFVNILGENLGSLPKQQSPVSVLENSTTSSGNSSTNGSVIMNYCPKFQVPVKARSKHHRRRRRDLGGVHQYWWSQEENVKKVKVKASATIGRTCQHCGAESTPQWRAGPEGPKTLCNACGVRFKSGRLVPEYRPASSPTFCSVLHSNSHRKVLEMRRQKQMMGIVVVKPMEKG